MCIRRETREKARRSLAFSPVSKPHTHITYMLICFNSAQVLYIYSRSQNQLERKYQFADGPVERDRRRI